MVHTYYRGDFLFWHRFIIVFLCITLIFTGIYLSDSADTTAVQTLATTQTLPLIIIDPGHGGIDGGTSGGDGTLEKDINLALSHKLNAFLTSMGFSTFMTRTDDRLIGEDTTIQSQKRRDIMKRLSMVEEQDNVILLSVHQNYYEQPQYSGFQVFYTENNSANQKLATCLQETVVSLMQPQNDRQIKTVGSEIYLLHHCTKPAVMVECGFMSNVKELSLLKNENYQSQMAFSLGSGLIQYINETV